MSAPGPSPKRRRTDMAPATNESIAQANAMMRAMTGNKQNRWMMGESVLTGGQPWAGREGQSPLGGGRGGGSGAVAGSGGPGTGGQQTPNAVGQDAEAAGSMAAPAVGSTLVEYESPYDTSTSAQAASTTVQSGRKSLDSRPRTPAGEQGLPSPAPSEENNVNSPLISNVSVGVPAQTQPQPRRGPGRPRKDGIQTPAATISPTAAQARPMWAAPARRVTSSSAALQGRSPSVQVQANSPRRSLSIQIQANAPSRLQRQHSSTLMHTIPSNASPRMLPTQYSQQSPQLPVFIPPGQSTSFVPNPAAVPTQTFAQYFDVNVLCQAIATQIQRLHNLDPSGANTRNDVARLTLSRDAVVQNDSFYLVLSQLFCLNSKPGGQKELPQSIRGVGRESWRRLGSLLCDNNSLVPPSINWFAEFPVPVMDVYSTQLEGFRAAYETQVAHVCTFLSELPKEWDKLVNASIERLAPPLVQDMACSLSLYSPILQTTAFRAIARTFWSQTKPAHQESGIETLVSLHQQDQARYYRGLFWSPENKKAAYVAMYRVYIGWKTHDDMYRNSAAASGAGMPHYHIPNDVLQIFGMQPPFVATNPNPNPAPPAPAHHRQPSGSGNAPSPFFFSPQQQQFLMEQNVTALQNQQACLINAAGGGRTRQSQSRPTPVLPLQPPAPPLQHDPRCILPRINDCPRAQPTHPDSTKSALHQAHLSSPILSAADVDDVKPKLYRYVEDCALGPEHLDKDMPMQAFTFNLRDDCMDRLPSVISGGSNKQRPTQSLLESSKQYRLRCCQIDMKTGFPTLSSWTEADNLWPENVMFDLNGTPLETRRKLQHGRYLPIDVTHLVQPGTNTLTVVNIRLTIDTSDFNYAVGIEVVGVTSHESLVSNVKMLSAGESLKAIKLSLSAPPDTADDDDLTISSSTLTLKLFDPISGSQIFARPVRGENCKHRDPFDLEIFLSQTQTPKNAAPGSPSTVDTWRCPICRKGVRPQTLIEDGFLVEVRGVLEKEGRLNTRAIVVEADGRWRFKAEEKTGVRSRSLEREEGVGVGGVERAKQKKSAEMVVIELD
ncbi:hypothetical protein LTR78_005988 [Recurvomyces mirabilis]|uniref:SP-RING-type domain-containing protein n=1 Tax=Recurvomyces mirabilis TaxID=574656 RepID=A0AAE1C0T3_9PEZI|nr:hypothetical protein LTR78_005988 [Recurvomyces mirabilis]KAK5155201.1 hypothetical protein LTS14_006156 [Recurvomyces mirabilis]